MEPLPRFSVHASGGPFRCIRCPTGIGMTLSTRAGRLLRLDPNQQSMCVFRLDRVYPNGKQLKKSLPIRRVFDCSPPEIKDMFSRLL